MKNLPKRTKRKAISDKYRDILEKPNLTFNEIKEMRYFMKMIAQTICEHVWKKKFY
jgi:tRNA C32,U32 (ribose-2'-O)-methylase TrmJ